MEFGKLGFTRKVEFNRVAKWFDKLDLSRKGAPSVSHVIQSMEILLVIFLLEPVGAFPSTNLIVKFPNRA